MTNSPAVTVEEIPLTPTPQTQAITPDRRVRLIGISPACLINLTGTTQPLPPHSRSTTRLNVLLDESSTEALRQDGRVDNTKRIKRPGPDVSRLLLDAVPTVCMMLAENDS